MNSFFDLLNGPVKAEKLLPMVLLYVGLMWLMFSAWVFFDSKKRFENIYISIAFFLLVLPFNFPALIFYLIIRPETEDEMYHHLHGSESLSNESGMNVPVINFVDKEGNIDMSINLKIHKKELSELNSNKHANLSLDVSWEADEEKVEFTEGSKVKKNETKSDESVIKGFKSKITKFFDSF
ncbi:MAG: hypothetical protein Q9M91_07945 [Candidatus Dojkabacteria bacterium]|nr:hypothetical protein [Candidatus Dojkabacteria bacterium]